MDIKIHEFACTATIPQPDGSVHLNDNNTIRLIDVNGTVIKPRESYLITISKVGTQPIIIEETQNEEEESKDASEEHY